MRLDVHALGRYCVRSRWGSVGRFAGLPLLLGLPNALGRRRWGAGCRRRGCRRRGCRRRLSTLRLSSLRRPGEPRRAGYTASAVPLFSTDGVIWGRNGSLGLEPRARAGLGSREGGAFEPFGEDLVFRAGLAQVQLTQLRLAEPDNVFGDRPEEPVFWAWAILTPIRPAGLSRLALLHRHLRESGISGGLAGSRWGQIGSRLLNACSVRGTRGRKKRLGRRPDGRRAARRPCHPQKTSVERLLEPGLAASITARRN